jgi:hypothetical protein
MDTRNNRLSVRVLAGMTIATIALELPVLAVPQPAPMLMAQVACVVSTRTAVFVTANPSDPAVLPGLPLRAGTPVALVKPLPSDPPARIEITNPRGFVDFAALDCGKPTPPPPKTTVCRRVRYTVSSVDVRRNSSYGSNSIAAVGAGQTVYVTQTGGVTTSRKDANGEAWIEVDLQKTFGKNFGISPSFGWLPNTAPNDPRGPLVTCN